MLSFWICRGFTAPAFSWIFESNSDGALVFIRCYMNGSGRGIYMNWQRSCDAVDAAFYTSSLQEKDFDYSWVRWVTFSRNPTTK